MVTCVFVMSTLLLPSQFILSTPGIAPVSMHVMHTQVLQEAGQVFGAAEQEPSRDAAESMQYTVACLKVRSTTPLLYSANGACSLEPYILMLQFTLTCVEKNKP